MMRGYRNVVNIIYWLALTIWIAALISAAVAAMNVFPTLDETVLTLERYAEYPEAEHPRLLAGRIMERVFFLVDLLQFGAAPVAVLALLVQVFVFGMPLRRAGHIIRAGCIVAAAGLLTYHATLLAPGMNRELRAYWAAAEAGEIEAARARREAFNAYHPRADAVLRLNLLLLLVAVGASAAAWAPTDAARRERLETPKLAKSR